MKFIESVYCSLQNINPDILHTKTRKREIVEARHSIIALTICYRGKKGLSYDNIADYYNYKEHSSVNYARKTVDILSDVQPFFKNRIAHRYQKPVMPKSNKLLGKSLVNKDPTKCIVPKIIYN